LAADIRRLALTGSDLHSLQEQFGADIVRGQIIDARQKINSDKDGHGMLTDLVDDEQFARAYRAEEMKLNPLEKAKLAEHVRDNVINDQARLELQQHYQLKGMGREQAAKKSIAEFQKHHLSDQDKELLGLIGPGQNRLTDAQLQRLLERGGNLTEEEEKMIAER